MSHTYDVCLFPTAWYCAHVCVCEGYKYYVHVSCACANAL